jgi:hypothetical protein
MIATLPRLIVPDSKDTDRAVEALRSTLNDIIRSAPILAGRRIVNVTVKNGGEIVKLNHLLGTLLTGWILTGIRGPAVAAGSVIEVEPDAANKRTQLWLKSVGFGVDVFIDVLVF